MEIIYDINGLINVIRNKNNNKIHIQNNIDFQGIINQPPYN